MDTLCLIKYDERVNDNNQGVIVFVPQSLQKPGKARFRLESLGTARRQTRKELLGNTAQNNAVGHIPPLSGKQSGENFEANEKLMQLRNPTVNVNLAPNNNHNHVSRPVMARPVNYLSTQTQRNTFSELAKERLLTGASVSNFQDVKSSRPIVNHNKLSYRPISLNQNREIRPISQCDTQHLELYEDVMTGLPIRQAEQQFFGNYQDIMEPENPQDEFVLNNFQSSDYHIPIQWHHPQNLQFQRAPLRNQQMADPSTQARLMNRNHTNNLSVPSIPQNLNVANYWTSDLLVAPENMHLVAAAENMQREAAAKTRQRVIAAENMRVAAAENMQHAHQQLGLQNNHIQENNSNQFQRKMAFKRRRGAHVHHNQFGLQTPQRRKYGQNRSHKPRGNVMNNAGYAVFNGQRRGNRFVSL